MWWKEIMLPIVFTKIDGGKIKISKKALTNMKKFIQDNDCKKEAGGVLLGRYIHNSLDIIVDEITIPMWGDRRKWFSFFRSHRPHQKVIDRLWQESDCPRQAGTERPDRLPARHAPAADAHWNAPTQRGADSDDRALDRARGQDRRGKAGLALPRADKSGGATD